jgi:hypothetical protein
VKLSNNFTLAEFIKSQTATRLDINNRPSVDVLIQLVYLAQFMEQVRALCGNRPISVSSGYRSEALNTEIGGSTKSDHISGLAVDFKVNGMSNRDTFNLIKRSHLQYKKLILEFPDSESGGWIHLAIAPRAQNVQRINLIATRVKGRTNYATA